jgi:hypothetical protein
VGGGGGGVGGVGGGGGGGGGGGWGGVGEDVSKVNMAIRNMSHNPVRDVSSVEKLPLLLVASRTGC